MLLRELFEAKAKRIVAVMPGGFHPFHPGHKSLYDWAVKTFGQSNVYVAATNDTAARPFPFDVKKKLAGMAGVPEANFIQVKSPFNAMSYKDIVDADTALVFVRSQKDKNEQPLPDQTKKNGEPGYLRTYTGKDVNTSDEMGYMAYGPTINFDFSGMQIKSASELRATWPEMSDEDKLKAAKLMYGNGAPVAVKLLNQALGDTEAPVGEDVSPEDEKKFHNELDDLVHKYFGDSPDEEKMKKKYRKTDEILGFATKRPKTATIKKKRPPEEDSVQDKLKKRRAMKAAGNPDAFKTGAIKEDDLNEAAPLVAAAIWIIKWAVRYGAWPVIKWLLKKHGGKIIGGAAAAYYIDQGWDWVVETIGEEYAQMLIDNKFEIGMAVALIIGAVALKKYMEKQGDKLVKANEAMIEKAPPGREKQVKALKKKFDDPGAPYAIAWAQHNKKKK